MEVKKLYRIYKTLYNYFGKQNWWPAQTKFEVLVGAVLTQNTAWSNVIKAVENLRSKKLLSFQKLLRLKINLLANLIKPAGYFNLKARRLKNLLIFFNQRYKGKLKNTRGIRLHQLRSQLLEVNGIGPETADSILLYAFDRPIFVVDAYTKRIFSRLKMIHPNSSYDEIQSLFMRNLKPNVRIFNEYHALIVKLGKHYCKKNKPNCRECPIKSQH